MDPENNINKLLNNQIVLQRLLFIDPSKIPYIIETPLWISELGHTLKYMIKENIIKKIYFDENENIQLIL